MKLNAGAGGGWRQARRAERSIRFSKPYLPWISSCWFSDSCPEFILLLFFAQNPDHVFTKEALLEKVWGMDCFGDSATITVHVGKIRDKIEKDKDSEQFIETIWGVGYRFKV